MFGFDVLTDGMIYLGPYVPGYIVSNFLVRYLPNGRLVLVLLSYTQQNVKGKNIFC